MDSSDKGVDSSDHFDVTDVAVGSIFQWLATAASITSKVITPTISVQPLNQPVLLPENRNFQGALASP